MHILAALRPVTLNLECIFIWCTCDRTFLVECNLYFCTID